MESIADYVADKARYSTDSHLRLVCPSCSNDRKPNHQHTPTLSVDVKDGKALFNCHHCGVSGMARLERQEYQPIQPTQNEYTPLTYAAIEYLESRGISEATAVKAGVKSTIAFIPEIGRKVECLAFPYRGGQPNPYAWKLRALASKSFAANGAPKHLFGIELVDVAAVGQGSTDPGVGLPLSGDNDDSSRHVVIVEGELDALSLIELGIPAVSVPHGAPSQPTRSQNRYSFLADILNKGPVTVATDNDAPGKLLANEIASLIGPENCKLVEWPEPFKDANACLTGAGAEVVRKVIRYARPFPVPGLHNAAEFSSHVDRLYADGLPPGKSTGWPMLDRRITVAEGMLYIVTGVPASGKTTFLNAMLVNLSKQYGWKHALASFENPIPLNIATLCAQYHCRPFSNRYQHRMGEDEMTIGRMWVNEHFVFLSADNDTPTVKSILERFRIAIVRHGVKTCVIDPANFIRYPSKDGDGPDTEAINQMLAALKTFAMKHNVAMFLVAHPVKPQSQTENWIPTGYSISGSSHYFNRADIGITVHRADESVSQIICWKARFPHIASNGNCFLIHDLATGTFREAEDFEG